MTNNNGPKDNDAGSGDKAKRPYATLDLKANEVSSGESAQQQGPAQDNATPRETPRVGARRENDERTGGAAGAGSILTHFIAGASGVVIALLFGYWMFAGPDGSEPGLTRQDAEALRTALANAESRIASLENNLQQATVAANEAIRLERDLSSLSDRVAAVETRPSAPAVTEQSVQQSLDPLTSQLSDLDRRLTTLAEAQRERRGDGTAMAMSLAFYNLQRAVREGKPYTVEMQAVARTAPESIDLAPLEPWSSEGIRTIDGLQASFDAAARAALDAENQPGDDSLASELWSQARSFVRVRRKGDVAGDSASAILARVEFRLGNGRLKDALAEAKTLDGPPAASMASWIESLENKIAVEDALAAVEAKMLSALGGASATRDG